MVTGTLPKRRDRELDPGPQSPDSNHNGYLGRSVIGIHSRRIHYGAHPRGRVRVGNDFISSTAAAAACCQNRVGSDAGAS
eukprot:3125608-Rhodomonas_salina.3